MKKKYDNDRLLEFDIETNTGKIPVYCVKPLSKNKDTKKLFLFVTGLNGNGSTIYYWNYPTFDNAYLVSYDGRAQANNDCKPSRFYKKYVKDIDIVLNSLKDKFGVTDIYIMGESCGSSLAMLYKKYYPDNIQGLITWNMPYKIKDVSKGNQDNKVKRNLNMLLTYIFSINTYDEAPFVKELTNNKLLIRTIKLLRRNRLSNKVIIASWKSFKPSWKYLLKHAHELDKLNITYIQSKEDIMQDEKIMNKLMTLGDKIHIFDQGYHILTFDENINDKLFELILSATNKKEEGK